MTMDQFLLKSSFEIEHQIYVVRLSHEEISWELLDARQPADVTPYPPSATDSWFYSVFVVKNRPNVNNVNCHLYF